MNHGDHPPRLELICFGPPTARIDGRPAGPEVLWRKHLALLIYLAFSPGRRRSREHMLGLLWPEKGQEHARHSLNEAVRRLRVSLGAGRIISERDTLALNLDGLSVDALDRGPGRAEFLEGFILADAPPFEEWAAAERARLRASSVAALVAEGEAALAASDSGAVREAGWSALTLDPYAEPAARLLVRAAALDGDEAGALRVYHDFAERLRLLGEGPSRDLAALADRIRHHRWRRASPAHATAPLPLVGRGAVHRAVFAELGRAPDAGLRVLAMVGAPGAGKSRLLSACLERLVLDGVAVFAAHPLERDQDIQWSVLRSLMRDGLATIPGVMGTDPVALAALAALVPQLAEQVAPRGPLDHAQAAQALASLLRSVADERPVAIAIDDAEWADGATLGALHAAAELVTPLPVTILLSSAEPRPETSRELLALYRDIGRSLPGQVVVLQPFTESDMEQLVRALAPWCRGDHDRDRLIRRLMVETGGDPFLAVTLLGGLQEVAGLRDDAMSWPPAQYTMDSPLPMAMPPLVRSALLARAGRLDPDSLAVLKAASTLGPVVDERLVAAMTELGPTAIEGALAALEERRFFQFTGERYVFAAPLIAEVTRQECLTPGQVRRYRGRAIEALAGREDCESRVLHAELRAVMAPGPEVFEEAAAVVRQALAAEMPRAARRALAAAERALAAAPGAGGVELASLRAQLNALADR